MSIYREISTLLLLLALVVSLLESSVSAAELGYWQCQANQWVAVGYPEHPMPIKVCGMEPSNANMRIPSTPEACANQGGHWGLIGIFPTPVCSLPTRDAGRICADSGECEGLCIAELSSEERDRLMHNHRTNVDMRIVRGGKCASHIPVVGCHAKVELGVVRHVVCYD